MRYQLVVTGVGGQGVIFLVRLLGLCAVKKGLPFIGTETHGMAQRGGTVVSHVKLGGFRAPLVGEGRADLLLGLYPTETMRFLSYLRKGGAVVTNADNSFPYLPDFRIFPVPAYRYVLDGRVNPKSVNVFLLGYATGALDEFPFTFEDVAAALEELNPRFAGENIRALETGYKEGSARALPQK